MLNFTHKKMKLKLKLQRVTIPYLLAKLQHCEIALSRGQGEAIASDPAKPLPAANPRDVSAYV